jgi:hypothetical protein
MLVYVTHCCSSCLAALRLASNEQQLLQQQRHSQPCSWLHVLPPLQNHSLLMQQLTVGVPDYSSCWHAEPGLQAKVFVALLTHGIDYSCIEEQRYVDAAPNRDAVVLVASISRTVGCVVGNAAE